MNLHSKRLLRWYCPKGFSIRHELIAYRKIPLATQPFDATLQSFEHHT